MAKRNSAYDEQELYNWCLEQTIARYMGELTPEQLRKLESINFPFARYEQVLDEMGFHWKKNNPNGVRYGKTIQSN